MTEALENTYRNIKIGIKDHNGLDLFNGDEIEILIYKDVKHKGVIVYDYGAFCLEHRDSLGKLRKDSLRSYASYCEITKIK